MTWRGTAMVAFLLACTGSAQVQGQTLGPSSARAQIVSVRMIPPSKAIESEGARVGSGIVIGHTEDAILILTSMHVIAKDSATDNIVVGVGSNEKRVLAQMVLSSDSVLDLALIRVRYDDWLSDGRWRAGAPRMLDVSHRPRIGDQTYLIGCPMGACWAPPLEARIAALAGDQMLVRTPYPIGGTSGGALVDDRGFIIGIVTGLDDVGLRSVRPWATALEWLSSHSVTVNIPQRSLEQTGQVWVEGQLPVPVNRRRSWELGVKVHRALDLVVGRRHVRTITSSPSRIDYPLDVLNAYFSTLGARYTRPINLFPVQGQPPVTVFGGVNRLLKAPNGIHRLQAIPDSFDLRTGEQAYHVVPSVVDANGWSVNAGVRMYVYRGATVRVNVTLIDMNLPPGNEDLRRTNLLEVGVGYRFTKVPWLRPVPEEGRCPRNSCPRAK